MLTYSNPLADAAMTEAEDRSLVQLVQSGSKEALELLITRHQRWIYNIALRMVCLPQDAEDATQEILVKVLTKLSTFRGESEFRTWLYRLAVNHLLNMKRPRRSQGVDLRGLRPRTGPHPGRRSTRARFRATRCPTAVTRGEDWMHFRNA